MKRLFTYGCSFTSYLWPTWPSFLTKNFDIVYNRGQAGAGNEFIFHSIVNDLKQFEINSKDHIMVMWTSFYRMDCCLDHTQWSTPGNLAFHKDFDVLNQYILPDGSIYKTFNYINAIIDLLKLKNIKFNFFDAFDLFNFRDSEELPRGVNFTIEAYPKHMKLLELKEKYFSLPYWPTALKEGIVETYQVNDQGNINPDGHPSIKMTIWLLKNIIQPHLDFGINPYVYELGNAIHTEILNKSPMKFPEWPREIMNFTCFDKIVMYKQDNLELYLDFYISCNKT